MNREVHVRFWERAEVKFLRATRHYFCVVPHKLSPIFTDTDHWERLPMLQQSVLFDDRFDRTPGPLNGRKAGRYTWTTSGVGYQTAKVSSGYLSAAGNTYFIMSRLTAPITEFGTEASSGQDSFTLAIGGSGGDIFKSMLHIHFGDGGAAPTWWNEGKAGQGFQGSRYIAGVPYERKPGAKRICQVSIRGQFAFAFIDGKQVLALCSDKIPALCEAATQIYCQNHMPAFGAERQYRAWVKTGRAA